MDISAYQHMNIRMTTRGKRPLRNLTPSDKVRAIQRIHDGETKASVSRDIGVPESTLRGWCKNEQKLRFMCRQLGVTDQFSSIQCMENPPEKRIRFNHHIQAPKFATATNFNEFICSRLPLDGLPLPANDNNTILEKMAFNDIIKKQVLSEHDIDPSVDGAANHRSTTITSNFSPVSLDYSLSMLQNLNLLSLLCHSSNDSNSPYLLENALQTSNVEEVYETNEISQKNRSNDSRSNNDTAVSISVKNWAKDYTDNVLSPKGGGNNNTNKYPAKDANNILKEKVNPASILQQSERLCYSTPLVGLLQIPNAVNTSDSENALFEWCKLFNASLNFMALAAAAAALNPTENPNISKNCIVRSLDNIVYNEFKKNAVALESRLVSDVFANSDLSNDSCLDSEPEDLSTRSGTTSKLSSLCSSRSQTPVKYNDSFSPVQSEGDL